MTERKTYRKGSRTAERVVSEQLLSYDARRGYFVARISVEGGRSRPPKWSPSPSARSWDPDTNNLAIYYDRVIECLEGGDRDGLIALNSTERSLTPDRFVEQ